MKKKKSSNGFIKNYGKTIFIVTLIVLVLVISILLFNPSKPKENESKFDVEEVNAWFKRNDFYENN